MLFEECRALQDFAARCLKNAARCNPIGARGSSRLERLYKTPVRVSRRTLTTLPRTRRADFSKHLGATFCNARVSSNGSEKKPATRGIPQTARRKNLQRAGFLKRAAGEKCNGRDSSNAPVFSNTPACLLARLKFVRHSGDWRSANKKGGRSKGNNYQRQKPELPVGHKVPEEHVVWQGVAHVAPLEIGRGNRGVLEVVVAHERP